MWIVIAGNERTHQFHAYLNVILVVLLLEKVVDLLLIAVYDTVLPGETLSFFPKCNVVFYHCLTLPLFLSIVLLEHCNA